MRHQPHVPPECPCPSAGGPTCTPPASWCTLSGIPALGPGGFRREWKWPLGSQGEGGIEVLSFELLSGLFDVIEEWGAHGVLNYLNYLIKLINIFFTNVPQIVQFYQQNKTSF